MYRQNRLPQATTDHPLFVKSQVIGQSLTTCRISSSHEALVDCYYLLSSAIATAARAEARVKWRT